MVEVGKNELGSSYPTYFQRHGGGTLEFLGDDDEENNGGTTAVVDVDDERLDAFSCWARFTYWDEYVSPTVTQTGWRYLGLNEDDL